MITRRTQLCDAGSPAHARKSTGAFVALAAMVIGVGCSSSTGTTQDSVDLGIFSETAPSLRPDVETFFGTFAGAGGVVSEFRSDASTKQEGSSSLRASLRSTGRGFAGWFVAWGDASRYSDEKFTRDMSRFAGGSLRFWVITPVDLDVGVRSGNVSAGVETSKTLLSQLGVAPGASWKRACLPLRPLAGASPLADLARSKILFVVAVSERSGGTGGSPVTVWIDDVRWDTRPC